MKPNTKTFFHNLDVLRFVAFTGVFFSHIVFSASDGLLNFLIHQGALGVDLFFVISGFLITYLLIKEKEYFSTIDLFKFFTRRAYRIYPLYFGFIIMLTVVSFLFFGKLSDDTTRSWLLYFVFLGNFDRLLNDVATINQFPGSGVLWSISIEEQFYLMIPLLLFFIKTRRAILFSLLIIHFCTYLFRILVIKSNVDYNLAYRTLHFHSIAQFSLISLGCLVAYAAFYYPDSVRKFAERLSKKMLLGFFLMFLGANAIFYFSGNVYVEMILGSEFFGLMFAASVIYVCFSKEGNRPSNSKIMQFLNYLGKISYGLYIYHVPCIFVLEKIGVTNPWVVLATGFPLTVLIAHLSYQYFESMFINLKKKYAVIPTR